MPRKSLREQSLTIPQVKKMLESIGEEKMDQFQRRVLNYASKFSRTSPEEAKILVKSLIQQLELEEEEAIQIVNCMPESVEEIRMFLAGGRKIVETSKLLGILKLLDEHRKKE